MYRLAREGGGQLVHASTVLGFKALTRPPPLCNNFRSSKSDPLCGDRSCWMLGQQNRQSSLLSAMLIFLHRPFRGFAGHLVAMLALTPNGRKLVPAVEWYCHAISPTSI